MDDKFLTQQLYAAQYFGFTPAVFVTYLYNSLSLCLEQGLEDFEKKLLDEVGDKESDVEKKLKEVLDKVLDKFRKRMDYYFDVLEVYLTKNVFRIPDDVLLPEDLVHMAIDYSKEKEDIIDQSLDEKRIRLKAIYKAKLQLMEELQELDQLQSFADQSLEEMKKTNIEQLHLENSQSALGLENAFLEVKNLQKTVTDVISVNELLKTR